mgnify:FL=1
MEYGCIGEKLTHSFSKIIHGELFDYDYQLKELAKNELDGFMKRRDFKAINVTIPYKQSVIPYLDEIDDTAREIGAVNTIVNKDDKLYGYNTDFIGMTELIDYNKILLDGKKVLILGSGGTSKTAFAVAKALNAKEVYRVSRGNTESCISYEDAVRRHNDAEIIINTTPCGMFPNIGNSPIDISCFGKLEGVVDAVYNPLRSALVVSALDRGIKATGGLYMLVSQAVAAAEKFTGKTVKSEKTVAVYKKLFTEKQNVVLIGMPGCGKSTIGKRIAFQLSKRFIDTDEEILKQIGISIPEFFERYGESKFREIETKIIKELSAVQNAVIATGGGAILNTANIDFLKENGVVFFIDRPFENLVYSSDRPLSSSRDMMKKRYDERYDLYKACADKIIKTSQILEDNITAVKKEFLE